MSERWEGNSSPEDHRSTAGGRAWNFSWHQWCYPDDWCETCRRDKWGDPWELVEALRAQVQRVRELPILGKAPQGNTALRGYNDGWNSCRMATLRALDGDSDE